ncbi:class I SAM-dependent methyltransferase [Salirhabdus sp. Marseille-P4669]|uniref:class I SAM-dependent methyltransferase n=1 Tax=Salirhabdus sp. Marseille-P4669 TaxID=2042310 RepID=UPI000C795A0D|nr:class I SAM-dependent methyltransferase [Salirhabdus sp. Marseille-P4669]
MIENTEERIIPEFMDPLNKLLLEHIARYQFALPYIKGRVLDLSCGSGYGTHMLAKERKFHVDEVIGVDIDPDIITYARGKYYHPKSKFIVADATDETLKAKLGLFDVIVSFETIEHIQAEDHLLRNYDELLKPGGTLLLSTPFGEGRGIPSGQLFHVHQLTQEEFFNLFGAYSERTYFYQKGVLIEPYPGREEVHYPLGLALCKK